MSSVHAEDLAGRWVYGKDDDGADLFYDLLASEGLTASSCLKYKEEAMEGLLSIGFDGTLMGSLMEESHGRAVTVGSIKLTYDAEAAALSSMFQGVGTSNYGEKLVAHRHAVQFEEVQHPPAAEFANLAFQVHAEVPFGGRIRARMLPDVSAELSGFELVAGETFEVSEVKAGDDGRSFLRLANGLGWIPTHHLGDSRPLIVPKIDCEDFGQTKVMYHCVSFLPAVLRSSPEINAKRNAHSILSGESVVVKRVVEGADGLKFLELADGRGWATTCQPTGAHRPIMVQGPRLAAASRFKGPIQGPIGAVAEPVVFVNGFPIAGSLIVLFLGALHDQFEFANPRRMDSFFQDSQLREYEKRALMQKIKEIALMQTTLAKRDAIYFFAQAVGLDPETLRTERSSRVSLTGSISSNDI